eukprot:1508369-Prymnesium_polylepis.2
MRGETLSYRECAFLLVNEPSSSRSAYYIGKFLQGLLLLSAFASIFETVTSVTHGTGAGMWIALKQLFSFFFSIEMILRLVSYVPCSSAPYDVYVWLDVLQVVPFWIRFLMYSDSMSTAKYLTKEGAGMGIRVLEAISSARLLKLCRYYEGASLLTLAIRKSLAELCVPLFMLAVMVYCFASVVYEIEWEDGIFACTKHWIDIGIDSEFIATNPDGVTWGCDM